MIANLLPSETTQILLDLFKESSLLVTFDGSFCQKVIPICSPNGLMLDFEVAGDRNAIAIGNYAQKRIIGQISYIIKMQQIHGWPVRATLKRET